MGQTTVTITYLAHKPINNHIKLFANFVSVVYIFVIWINITDINVL